MLIDSSYFTKGSRQILNATSGKVGVLPDKNAIQVNGLIEAYVDELQYEFLEGMLGQEIGSALNRYITSVPGYALQRRVDAYLYRGLEDGCIRSIGEAVKEENKFFDEIAKWLCEPFADYVFFHILRISDTQSTVTGLVRLKCANEYVSPIRRQVYAWNTMVNKNRKFVEWINFNRLKGIKTSSELLQKINVLNL